MGQRRMFSLKIMNSARFLKMPIDTQNLYFHLGMRADDDGVVEAFSVIRLVGSSDDNLKLLHAKGFVKVLNEDLVTYITDWNEHNTIRADRKIDSIYKDLLVQIIPNVKLLEARERTDRKKDGNKHGTSQGQPMDGLSKDKLSKVNKNINEHFERLWSLYPLKKGKARITDATKKKLQEIGFDTISKCIERYVRYIEKNNKQKYFQHGGTFFTSGYVDYLDENYTEEVDTSTSPYRYVP